MAIGTAIFAVFSVFYALSLPNIYESESVLSAVEQGSNENSAFGGLASMVGITLSGESSKRIDVTMETAKSVDFYVYLNQKRNIDKYLTAIEVYSYGEDKLYFNEEIYDSSENKWVVDENGQDSKPSDFRRSQKSCMNYLTLAKIKSLASCNLNLDINHT